VETCAITASYCEKTRYRLTATHAGHLPTQTAPIRDGFSAYRMRGSSVLKLCKRYLEYNPCLSYQEIL
jgi:hypothetical protein